MAAEIDYFTRVKKPSRISMVKLCRHRGSRSRQCPGPRLLQHFFAARLKLCFGHVYIYICIYIHIHVSECFVLSCPWVLYPLPSGGNLAPRNREGLRNINNTFHDHDAFRTSRAQKPPLPSDFQTPRSYSQMPSISCRLT